MKNKDSESILRDRARQRSARSCGAADSVVDGALTHAEACCVQRKRWAQRRARTSHHVSTQIGRLVF